MEQYTSVNNPCIACPAVEILEIVPFAADTSRVPVSAFWRGRIVKTGRAFECLDRLLAEAGAFPFVNVYALLCGAYGYPVLRHYDVRCRCIGGIQD